MFDLTLDVLSQNQESVDQNQENVTFEMPPSRCQEQPACFAQSAGD